MVLKQLLEHKSGKLSEYLSKKFGRTIRISSITKLGEGCHGVAYKAISKKNESFILKQFSEKGRNLEFKEDRIREALLIQRTANELDNHIRIHNVSYVDSSNKLSDYPYVEPIIIMEEIQQEEYFKDLDSIATKKELSMTDKIKIKKIALYLAQLHSKKLNPKYYHRYLKDWFSFGILELVNELRPSLGENKVFDLKKKFLEFEHDLHLHESRCSQIHGEFFPGTIHFDTNNDLKTYDMRRIGAGEPADDVGSILFNFYAFSFQAHGEVTPWFEEAADLFLDTYIGETADVEIIQFLPAFMAYRCLILAHPDIVPMNEESRKLLRDFLFDLVTMKQYDKNKFEKYK